MAVRVAMINKDHLHRAKRVVDASGADRCAEDGPGPGVGALDCLARVSSQGNGRVGLVLQGRRRVEARLVSLSGTRTVDGSSDGEGAQVRDGATLVFDPSIRADAARGMGSLLVGNARVGLLAQGTGVALRLSGAQVNANTGPGVFIAGGARAEVVGYSELRRNGALGLGVTRTGSIAAVQCNGIAETRMAMLATSSGTLSMFGDGLAIDQGAGVEVTGNVVSGNARFGAVFQRVAGTFMGNTGAGNLHGQGVYDSSGLAGGDVQQIMGTTPPPRDAPTFAADMRM